MVKSSNPHMTSEVFLALSRRIYEADSRGHGLYGVPSDLDIRAHSADNEDETTMFNWISDFFSGSDSNSAPSSFETSPSHGDFSDAFGTACPNQVCAESNYGDFASHSYTDTCYGSSSTDWSSSSSMSDFGSSIWD